MAVLKLDSSSSASLIHLNSNKSYPAVRNTPLTVIGFGATSENGDTSNVLKKLGTFFETIDNCKLNYPEVEKNVQLCADVDNQGDCQGDSGGPLFDANDVQVGIVSYGYGCARPQEDVYTDVAGYYDWIMAQISDDSCGSDSIASANNCLCPLFSCCAAFQGLRYSVASFLGFGK